jgi:thiol-disulfide isomerase/thioredoxin
MNSSKGWYIFAGVLVIVGVLFAYPRFAPAQYDEFAQCLEEKGATFYGAFWCPNCDDQKRVFGNSAKELPYVECSTPDRRGQLSVCSEAGITAYPTWEFEDGSRHSGVLSLAQLSSQTGCALK